MAKKLIQTIENGARIVKVYRDSDYQEFIARLFVSGEEIRGASYHTSDKSDALQTAQAMAKTPNNGFEPTPEQLQAVALFKARYSPAQCKARGFSDWRDALCVAWARGWDDSLEMGGHLRQIRNTKGGMQWAAQAAIE